MLLITPELDQPDHEDQSDMGWPDLLVSDAMMMMAADDSRG
jgi:hypothetical protein